MFGIRVNVVQRVVLSYNRRVVELKQEVGRCQEQEEVPGYYTRVAVE